MNTNFGLIGKKIGTTQTFTEDGELQRVTAIETGPCVVVTKRTTEKDGYTALQLGFGKKKEKKLTKPEVGFFAKKGIETPEILREFRVTQEILDKYEVGQVINLADVFDEGQFVDVAGTSKGRGFAGVMKRHNFGGAGTVGHGTHEYKRHGGSIGQNMTPGRVFKGMKMPGQYGNSRTTVMNLKVVKIMNEEGLLLINGSIPGPKNGVVIVRGAVKKNKLNKV